MLELVAAYLLRNNAILGVLLVSVLVYHANYYIKIYFDHQHELDKMRLENDHKLEMQKADAELSLEKEKLKQEFQLQLSEAERNFAMVNDVILKVCQGYTEPQKEVRKGWFSTEEIWVRPEYGMEHCVRFLNKYLTSLDDMSKRRQIGGREEDWNHRRIG